MKVYFYIPYFQTGGPEAFHQYSYLANVMGYNSYMYYHDAPSIAADCLYTDKYPGLRRACVIEDHATNVLFLPEIYDVSHVRTTLGLKHIKVVLSWLSFDYGQAHLEQHVSDPSITHTFQSMYARKRVTDAAAKRGVTWLQCFDLYDFLHDTYLLRAPLQKQNYVAYNPKKDIITKEICDKHNIPCIPIADMSTQDVIATLQICKVYVDCGYHPGRDRIPREAAILGCVVVTNMAGSAAFWDDVPIAQKANTSAELVMHIMSAFDRYDDLFASQQQYRKMIENMKEVTAKQLRTLLSTLHIQAHHDLS